ncbi:MAG: hypothetical protein V4568_18840 [Pseudomonadota bacterium]
MTSIELSFPPDDPAANGHFPGNPIIPGAVLLSEVLRAIEAQLGVALWPCQIKMAKFFNPVRPGDQVQIDVTNRESSEIRFTCMVDGKSVLAGQVVKTLPLAAK